MVHPRCCVNAPFSVDSTPLNNDASRCRVDTVIWSVKHCVGQSLRDELWHLFRALHFHLNLGFQEIPYKHCSETCLSVDVHWSLDPATWALPRPVLATTFRSSVMRVCGTFLCQRAISYCEQVVLRQGESYSLPRPMTASFVSCFFVAPIVKLVNHALERHLSQLERELIECLKVSVRVVTDENAGSDL